jgi:hypothetical protein
VQLCDTHELLLLVRQARGRGRPRDGDEEVVYQENMTTFSLNTHDVNMIPREQCQEFDAVPVRYITTGPLRFLEFWLSRRHSLQSAGLAFGASTGPCPEPDQSIPCHHTSLRSILILSTHLRLGLHSGLFPSVFLTSILDAFFFSPIRAIMASFSVN